MDPELPSSKDIFRLRERARRLHTWNRQYRLYDRVLPIAFLAGIAIALGFYFLFSPPRDFAAPAAVRVTKNETLAQIASQLKEQHIVRSANLFAWIVRILGGNTRVKDGTYFFPGAQNLLHVALRFRNGDFELNPVRVNIAEDMDIRDIAALLSKKIAPFDSAGFLATASSSEGYLYPDTYFFYPDEDPHDIVTAMETNFQNHIDAASTTIEKSGHPLKELVTMASILVGEARTDTDRRTVAGILWKRISIGMPLQVDAPFGYVLDKPLTQLKSDDLKIDSPYNTYLNKGLPPTPIGNPSIEAILAAATPIKSNYLYYLSDNNGTMHFSTTFAAHEAQISAYLK